ncbi:30S ribosomal protein S14 [Parvularcula dongshanensis]|uniref:Small ribosomal subunit protein uS14 n=1 Tax=Parvularcula dongshanensis TaxID=1173995 RepID=A0A840I3K7_9PROT|nr:30S ribosomal protein S14 [Parvularcula dongshanensis]MBB4658905.1 small subunit ribosomal protein S14 [Parvularcula dongshanensis]
MAKKSMIERDVKRRKLASRYAGKRDALKAQMRDESTSPEEKFRAAMKLAELPRNSSPTRIRNRCLVSGRPRGYYRKLKMSRIALRELGSLGKIPGLVKSSW